MNLLERLNAFEKLGLLIKGVVENNLAQDNSIRKLQSMLADLLKGVNIYNAWFTEKEVQIALHSISEMLSSEQLINLMSRYPELNKHTPPVNVGIIMAGNIPMVGFHDFFCVLISGNNILAKLSSDDDKLLPMLAKLLIEIEPSFESQIKFTDAKLEKIDAIIATGSNNSARYFDYYFSKYPNIIRKNRNSLAVLTGNETLTQLQKLGGDIFQYYGLGCRSVSKLMVPEGYNFNGFFEAIYDYSYVITNNKYVNNYEYNRTIYLMNSIKMLDNNFLLLKEDIGLASPVGVLYYEYYTDVGQLKAKIKADAANIQCIAAADKSMIENSVSFGETQCPSLLDYADGVDVISFLLNLKRK